MTFQQQKRRYLCQLASEEKDKSKKGYLDQEVKELVDLINDKEHYYTTSSCSGRLVIYAVSSLRKKQKTQWLLVSHRCISFESAWDVLKKIPSETVWFRFEPLILHVVCEDIESARRLLRTAIDCGLKHSGIIGMEKRIIIEIRGVDYMDAPVACAGSLIITKETLALFVAEANKKMQKNRGRIEKLMQQLLLLDHEKHEN